MSPLQIALQQGPREAEAEATAPQSSSCGGEREFASHHAEGVTCYPDDVEADFARETENRKMQISHGGEEVSVSQKVYVSAPAKVVHGHLVCVVETANVCSFGPCLHDAQGSGNDCSFQTWRVEVEENARPSSFLPSFEEASETEKLRPSENSSCLLRGAAVNANVIWTQIVSERDCSPCHDEVESGSANLNASERSSSSSCCSLTYCRYAHASYAMGFSLAEVEQVPA